MARLAGLLIPFALLGCTSPLMLGEECTNSADCEVGLSCFFVDVDMTRSVCMSDCDEATTRLCAGGEVYIPATTDGAPRELGVCFLGGTTPVGSPCTNTFGCTLGALCVDLGGSEQTCYRACSTGDGSACTSTETCEGLVGMGTKGYCAPMTP